MRAKRKEAIKNRKILRYHFNIVMSKTAILMVKSSRSAVKNGMSLPRKDRRIRAMVNICKQRVLKEVRENEKRA